MGKQVIVWLLGMFVLTSPFLAEAQPVSKFPRIGVLSSFSQAAVQDRVEAFRQGLGELGYTEGKNINLEYRYAEGKRDRYRTFTTELAGLKVEIIVAAGGSALVRAIKETTGTIPIVMTTGSDPIAAGLIASLARPGGNVTGLTSVTLDLSGKRVELLKEAVPKLSRVAVLYDADHPAKIIEFKETEAAARNLGVEIQSLGVRKPNDFETAFESAARAQAHGLITLQSPLTARHQKKIADLALKGRLPTMVAEKGLLEAGGLMSYGPDYVDLYRRAATYVDKILKGAKPADLPVEQPTKFELVINLKTAKQIGLTVPPNVLARADTILK